MKVDVGDLTVPRSVVITSTQLGFSLEVEEEDFGVLELELFLFLFFLSLVVFLVSRVVSFFLDDVLEDDVVEGGTLVSFVVVLVRYGSKTTRI